MNFFLLVSIVVGLFLLGACSSSNANEDQYEILQNRGYLVVGLDDTFAPMGFRNENNELIGFDIDVIKAVGDRMGLEFRMQPIDWGMKETELNNQNIDLIWNGYTITDERKEKVNFSIPYLTNRQVIVVLEESLITNKAELSGSVVAVQRESSALSALMADAQLLNGLQGKAPVEFDTNLEAFMDLEAKRVDALVVDEVLADYVIKQRGEENYRYLDEDMGMEEYGIGVRKADITLRDEINRILTQMMEDGSFDEIRARWFAGEKS